MNTDQDLYHFEISLLEVWKDIPGYKGKYQASSYGRIRSLVHKKIKVLNFKNKINGAGYYGCHLGRGNSEMVHRLVAKTFLQNIKNKKQVNHKNCNKLDNHFLNLEWVSPKENIRHAIKKGRYNKFYKSIKGSWKGSRNPKAKISMQDAVSIRKKYKKGVIQIELAKEYGISQATVSEIILKKCWV